MEAHRPLMSPHSYTMIEAAAFVKWLEKHKPTTLQMLAEEYAERRNAAPQVSPKTKVEGSGATHPPSAVAAPSGPSCDLTKEEISVIRAQCSSGCRLFDGTDEHDVCADKCRCALQALCDATNCEGPK